MIDAERERLVAARDGEAAWYRWGPYLADRQWGTVREDYSPDGDAWAYLPHDHARSRAYRWGEDGLLGITDDGGRLCFALALWNGRDPILKERLFGLTNPQGNHGEDVKEAYFYLDATPTASYLRALYKYPLTAFPYQRLIDENARRTRDDPEFDLADTGVFDADRYVDVEVEYAKARPADIVIRIGITNRAAEAADIDLLPTLWFRNTWSWGIDDRRPTIVDATVGSGPPTLRADHHTLGTYRLTATDLAPILLADNESNAERLWGVPSRTPSTKDAFHDAVIGGDRGRLLAPNSAATKAALHLHWTLAQGETRTTVLRLAHGDAAADAGTPAVEILEARRAEADAFYASVSPPALTDDERLVQRQAFAGLIWAKQSYHFDVARWLDGDPVGPPPAPQRRNGRNKDWRELNTDAVLSMPDPWEYPWFASWDLAFHCIPLALVDPEFAKAQLTLLTREWYMHPNGQLPAYEWDFSDVNPPVHAWATWRVYKIEKRMTGTGDRSFLERTFHKLLLNFTWWVNRKDTDGHNVFQGGFLGLDNIGVFDRSAPLPVAGHVGQADGTAWMGFYCLEMLRIALELAVENPVYEDIASKFFEHFLYIAGALNGVDIDAPPLWDDADGFFYDVIHLDDGGYVPLKVRSLVGLVPLLAVQTLEPELLERTPGFRDRMSWFLDNRPQLASLVPSWEEPGVGRRRLLALVHGHRLKALLARMLDPDEFLSPHGVRSLSRVHLAAPFMLDLGGSHHEVRYEPAESRSGLFGGNSNWRGPVWFPIAYLIIEALQKFHRYYGDDFRVELPTGSATTADLGAVATDVSRRLTRLFVRDESGRRAVFGDDVRAQTDPHWRDYVLFHEFFDGDTGRGLGAAHQTGWTALVAKLLDQLGRSGTDG